MADKGGRAAEGGGSPGEDDVVEAKRIGFQEAGSAPGVFLAQPQAPPQRSKSPLSS